MAIAMFLSSAPILQAGDVTPALPSFAERGRLVLTEIEHKLRGTGRNAAYYVEELKAEPGFKPSPCFAWPAGVQLAALIAIARVDPAHGRAPMFAMVKAVDTYWFNYNGVGGFCAVPRPQSPDRYYDDNAWLVLDFVEAYEVTKDMSLLKRARDTMKFILSGEDQKLGGGLYWHEQKKESKNACINAPAVVCALKLYQHTRDPAYLAAAHRLYDWTRKNLQDPDDGLYLDHMSLDGKLDRRKFSYNTALMIRAAVLFYDQTHEQAYLDEAKRLAQSAEKQWFKSNGAVADDGFFAYLLAESMLELGEKSHDEHWRELVARTCDFIWTQGRDPNGHFPNKWDQTPTEPLKSIHLIAQASAARIFLVMASLNAAKK